jgi:hypothetical protein
MLELIEETHSALQRRFKGGLLRPQHHGYEEARAIWNGMVAKIRGSSHAVQTSAMCRTRSRSAVTVSLDLVHAMAVL